MLEQLESLAASRMFTQLDLASGYLQIPLTDEASAKTAFITADTTGQFNRMPFGLSGAVAEFTRLMQRVLGPLQGKIVRNYLDDMVIGGRDWTEMLTNLGAVLERLRGAKLTLKPSKCSFGAKRIEFLGFVVEGGEIRPGFEKTRAIADFPVPTDAHAVRRFLGLTGFFRRFVDKYAVIADPLTRLMRKGTDFCWGQEQSTAFQRLKEHLTGDAVQVMFRADAGVTELHTDASAIRLGAILMQSGVPGSPLRMVYCASRKTSDAESRYHSSKLELLCVVWAVNKLRQFLLGVPFVVYTDCQALAYLNSYKNTSSQVAHWHDSLQDYDITVKYRPGAKMGHVDDLSRAPASEEIVSTDQLLAEQRAVCIALSEEEQVRMCQRADEELAGLVSRVEKSTDGTYLDYVVEDGLLYRRRLGKLLFVMPKSMRKSLVVVAHDLSGHPAVDRTMANLLQDFWFTGMKRYVKQHIRMYFECLMTRTPRGKRPGLLHPIALGNHPFETVHMDHVGPFVETSAGSKYILTMVDNFTKYVELFAVRRTGTEEILRCVRDFVSTYGLPKRFITDRGTCFTSKDFSEYCIAQGIQLILNSSRHPQANGQVERIHSVVMATLVTQNVAPEAWDLSLTEVRRIINNSESKVTIRTPFELLHGYRPRFQLGRLRDLSKEDNWTPPEELREASREKGILEKERVKEAYDRHRHDNIHYTNGEIVVMRRAPISTGESTKLQDRYRGPLLVTEVLPGDTYRVVELDSSKKSQTGYYCPCVSTQVVETVRRGLRGKGKRRGGPG